MKNFKYYSLAALSASQVYARNDAWRGEVTNEIKFIVDDTQIGSQDVVFPMNVDVANTPANAFYKIVDVYLGNFESWHYGKDANNQGGWSYQVNHYGAPTLYNPNRVVVGTLGWNAIFSDQRLIVAWEGDMLNCAKIGTGSVSDVVCSKQFAEEYCHRHGGEMFFPDDKFFKLYFKPMCITDADRDAAENLNNAAGDEILGANKLAHKANNPATFSQDNYWMGLERVVDPANSNQFNVRTSAHQHLNRKFNDNNIYTGWNENQQVCDAAGIAGCNTDPTRLTQYEWLIGTSDAATSGGPPTYFPVTAFQDANNLNRFSETNLNMQKLLVDNYLLGNIKGLQSQDCTYIRCSAEATNVLQDTPCDANNIRPLCVMNDLISPKRVCPKDLLSTNFPNEYQCGENVHEILVAALYGSPGITQLDGQVISIHNYGKGNNGESIIQNNVNLHGTPTNIELNYIFSLRETLDLLGLGAAIPSLSLYINCMGQYRNGNWVLTGRDFYNVCKQTYEKADGTQVSTFVYQDGPGNDEWTVQENPNSEATTTLGKVGSVKGACQCENCGPLTFTDANAESANAIRTELVVETNENIAYFCCADGYEFVPNNGYTYERVTTQEAHTGNNGDTCNTECVKVKCQDEFATDSDQQVLPFWTQNRDLRDANGNLQYNIRKVWKHFGGAAHADQSNIQGTCQPRKCVAPPTQQPDNTVAVDHTGKTYDIGASYTAQCSGNFCGSHTATCNTVADLTARGDICLGSQWTWTGSCGPKTCSISAPANGSTDQLINIGNGVTVTSQCNTGFIARFADGTDIPNGSLTDTCTITAASPCNTVITQRVVCVPVTCPAPPAVNGFVTPTLPGASHVAGTTVQYQCSAGTCGVQQSVCTVIGNVGSWTTPNAASCVARRCVVKNGLGNGVAVTDREVAAGATTTLECNQGFLYQGQRTVAKTCVVPPTTELCSDPNGACCQIPIVPTEECTPLTCNIADACQGNNFKPQTGVAQIGDEVTCECIDSLVLSGTQNNCKKVCTLDNQTNTASFQNQGQCTCEPPACPLPADIPHGKPVTPTGADITGTKIDVDGSISYECDADYDLVFSHNHAPATRAQCLRFCYVPPPNTCGTDRTDVNYSPQAPIAHLDPLNCYCKPKACSAVPATWADHTLVNEEQRSQGHYYSPGYDLYKRIDVQCAAPKFSASFGANSKETLTCGPEWSNPAACVRIGCPNPRTATGIFTASVNLEHTCKSLDQINLNPSDPNSSFVAVGTAGAVYSDQTTLPFAVARSNTQLFTTAGGDGTTTPGNVVEGAKARFTCKKGYSPYFNAVQAMTAGIEKQNGNSFECTCVQGVWTCNYSCRCQDACVNC